MKRLLYISLIVNILLLSFLAWSVQKLGGFGYTWHRLSHREWGVYYHRAQHFERLPDRPGSVVFLGDSQIEQAEWHEFFGDNPMVLNRGISGDYIAGVQARLGEILRHKPSKIFLLVGVNDLFFEKPLPEMERDYNAIVQRIRTESPQTELFLLSLLPVNNHVRDIGIQNSQVTAFNAIIQKIARSFALPYVDVNTPLTDADGNLSAKFTDDGLHINGLGYGVVKKALSVGIQ